MGLFIDGGGEFCCWREGAGAPEIRFPLKDAGFDVAVSYSGINGSGRKTLFSENLRIDVSHISIPYFEDELDSENSSDDKSDLGNTAGERKGISFPEVGICLERVGMADYGSVAGSLPQKVVNISLGAETAENVELWLSGDVHIPYQRLDESFRKNVDREVMNAMERYVAEAEREGRFLFPFLSCAAMRMSDGTRMPLTEPILLTPVVSAPIMAVDGAAVADGCLSASVTFMFPPCRVKMEIGATIIPERLRKECVALEMLVSPQWRVMTAGFHDSGSVEGIHTVADPVSGSRVRAWNIPVHDPVCDNLEDEWSVAASVPVEALETGVTVYSDMTENHIRRRAGVPDFGMTDISRMRDAVESAVGCRRAVAAPAVMPPACFHLPCNRGLVATESGVKVYIRSKYDGKEELTVFENVRYAMPDADGSPSWIFYPDRYAVSLTVCSADRNVTFPLTPCEEFGGAVWRKGFRESMPEVKEGEYRLEENAEIIRLDKEGRRMGRSVFLSAGGCRDLFPSCMACHSLPSEILGLSPALRSVSSGQLGSFPLYCFTGSGIWVMSVSEKNGVQPVQCISLLRPIERGCVVTVAAGTLFMTSGGLYLLDGGKIRRYSDYEPWREDNEIEETDSCCFESDERADNIVVSCFPFEASKGVGAVSLRTLRLSARGRLKPYYSEKLERSRVVTQGLTSASRRRRHLITTWPGFSVPALPKCKNYKIELIIPS